MNREDLDAFFAKAEDVLTNWEPSVDAMVAKVPDEDDPEALPGDSYYDQRSYDLTRFLSDVFRQSVLAGDVHFRVLRGPGPSLMVFDETHAFTEWQSEDAFDEDRAVTWAWVPSVADPTAPTRAELDAGVDLTGPPTDPRERALWLRRNRNTGPADHRGLDGRTRRQ